MKKIVVLASGSGTDLQSVIDACESGFISGKIEAVICNKEGAYCLERARIHNIKAVLIPSVKLTKEEFDSEVLKVINGISPDLIVLAGYLKILDKALVEKYQKRIINIHPSLIPAFCGMGFYGIKVHEAVLKSGVKLTGSTVHFVDSGADTGPIIMQKAVPVYYEDSAEELQKRVLEQEHIILPLAVKLFCDDKLQIIEGRVKVLN